jgi:hypothetical protein
MRRSVTGSWSRITKHRWLSLAVVIVLLVGLLIAVDGSRRSVASHRPVMDGMNSGRGTGIPPTIVTTTTTSAPSPPTTTPPPVTTLPTVTTTVPIVGGATPQQPDPARTTPIPTPPAPVQPPEPPRARIALYGDSLAAQAQTYFDFSVLTAGAAVENDTLGGTAICDALPEMATDAQTFRPDAVVIEFSGNTLTPCMAGIQGASQALLDRYSQDATAAIGIFRAVGAHVFLIGAPMSESQIGNPNWQALNDVYQSLAQSNPGVTFVDAGESVMENGTFTFSLPCLSFEPCLGSDDTNAVRGPDGTHFCATPASAPGPCPGYSSGAFRFGLAMASAVLEGLGLVN